MMKKDVIVTVEGLQEGEEDSLIKSTAKGIYSYQNQTHYIKYDEESQDGDRELIKTLIKIKGGQIHINKKSAIHTRMLFIKDNNTRIDYSTSFGDLSFHVFTNKIQVEQADSEMLILLDYTLTTSEVTTGEDQLSRHHIRIHIKECLD